ncbi:MAG: GTP-binding protein [Candidatus Helarchaeota archaeon]
MTFREADFRFKCVLFGNEAVGKTSLVERFMNNRFEEFYISTLGYNVYEKQVTHGDILIALTIFDIGGQEKFRDLRRKYAEGAHAAFIVYDVTNRASFENVPQWKKDLDEFVGIIPFILIGNKIDLERVVSKKEAEDLRATLNAPSFLETSAKDNLGVEKAFRLLALASYKFYSS